MEYRRDALQGTARVISGIRTLVQKQPKAVVTIGSIKAHPGSINTIPGEVFFTLDLRHPDGKILSNLDRSLWNLVKNVCSLEGLKYEIDLIWEAPTVIFDEQCVGNVRNAARSLNYPSQDIVSGAGHDACQMSHVVPTGMIFIPCKDGISHNEIESATPEHVSAGANVLLHAVLSTAD